MNNNNNKINLSDLESSDTEPITPQISLTQTSVFRSVWTSAAVFWLGNISKLHLERPLFKKSGTNPHPTARTAAFKRDGQKRNMNTDDIPARVQEEWQHPPA